MAKQSSKSFMASIDNQTVDAYAKNEHGYNLLHQLINNGKLGIAKQLVTQGMDVNIKTTNEGMNAFQLVCNLFAKVVDENGKSLVRDLAKTILSTGTYDFKVKDNQGWGTWHWAIELQDPEVFQLIKEPVNNRDKNGLTALDFTCGTLNAAMVEALSVHKANFGAQDSQGLVPYARSCSKVLDYRKQNIKVAHGPSFEEQAETILDIYLTQGNFNIHTRTSNGDSLLHWTLGLRSTSSLEKLCVRDIDKDAQDKDGQTCVFWSAKYNWTQGIECLGKFGANMDMPNHKVHVVDNKVLTESITPLLVGLTNNPYDFNTVKVLVSYKANIDKPSPTSGNTPLITSVMFDHPDATEYLLEQGASANIGNYKGITPLIMSVLKGNSFITTMLASSEKVDINQAAFSTGETPFLISILKKNAEMVQLFLSQRASSIENFKSISPSSIMANCKNKLKDLQESKDFSSLKEVNQDSAKEVSWDILNLSKHTELVMDLMGDDYPIDESSVAFGY